MHKYYVYNITIETYIHRPPYLWKAKKLLQERECLAYEFISHVDIDLTQKPDDIIYNDDEDQALFDMLDKYDTYCTRFYGGMIFHEYLMFDGDEVDAWLKALDDCEEAPYPCLVGYSTSDMYDEEE